MKNKRPLLFALSLSLAAGCAPEPSSFSLDECDDSEVCDVDIKALWKHRKDVDVSDLVNIGAGFATDALNDALGNVVALDKPELYTSSDSTRARTRRSSTMPAWRWEPCTTSTSW